MAKHNRAPLVERDCLAVHDTRLCLDNGLQFNEGRCKGPAARAGRCCLGEPDHQGGWKAVRATETAEGTAGSAVSRGRGRPLQAASLRFPCPCEKRALGRALDHEAFCDRPGKRLRAFTGGGGQGDRRRRACVLQSGRRPCQCLPALPDPHVPSPPGAARPTQTTGFGTARELPSW